MEVITGKAPAKWRRQTRPPTGPWTIPPGCRRAPAVSRERRSPRRLEQGMGTDRLDGHPFRSARRIDAAKPTGKPMWTRSSAIIRVLRECRCTNTHRFKID